MRAALPERRRTLGAVLVVLLWVFGQGVSLAEKETSDEAMQVYLEFRRWFNEQPKEVQQAKDVLRIYGAHLAETGLTEAEVAARLSLQEEGADRSEVEMWNRILTSDEPRFNTDPNEFLVRMVAGREPGRALDVGMGQGRNAIWLAQEGWDVTGFDPAERAVARAHELARAAGVEIQTETVGSEEFDWGTEQWDLVVLSYVTARPWIDSIHAALRPRGLVLLEAFHLDATKESSIGRGVVYETNELLRLFSDFRILHYEDTADDADFGRGETRVVRLLAEKR